MRITRRRLRRLLGESKEQHLEKLMTMIRTGDPENIAQAAELGAAIDVDLYTAIYNDPEAEVAMLESLVPDGDQDEMVFWIQEEVEDVMEKFIYQYAKDAWLGEWLDKKEPIEMICEDIRDLILKCILDSVCEDKFRGHWND
tara:strand:+ start:143 stop:568 length:426 start_codon:yes stop_codon:yes gene_type:complete